MTHTVVLIIGLHQVVDPDSEMTDLAQLAHLFGREEKPGHVPEVLAHSPECLASVNIGMVPLQKLLGCCDVLGYWLLGQNMLASEQCLLDELWLDQDRETRTLSA